MSNTERFERVARLVDPQAKLVRTWELKGGVSAEMTALELVGSDGRTRKLVVRRHEREARQGSSPRVADEVRLLRLLRSRGLAVPVPRFVDQTGTILPAPYGVFDYVEGEPEFSPAAMGELLQQMSAQLAAIHAVSGLDPDLSFLPDQTGLRDDDIRQRPPVLDELICEGRVRDVLERVWPPSSSNGDALLHGDFWPGNILWRDARIVAVIDWEDAARGDPLSDLAIARLEILWAFGVEAMHAFTEQYRSVTSIDLTRLPVWDLCAALRPAGKIDEWASDEVAATAMRRDHRAFVEQALAALG